MKDYVLTIGAMGVVVAAATFGARAQNAVAPQRGAAPARPAAQTFTRKGDVGARLAPSEQAYAAIDSAKLMQYVEEMTAVSRKYRDNGHPQFWGRITGTSADAENAEWMLAKFKQFGLADVHMQTFDLPPQWMARSWDVTASAQGKSLPIATAQPTYQGVATPAGGLDLEAVYVGMGSDADIALARDVKGKAAVFYSTDISSRHQNISDGAVRRLEERGAAAILIVLGISGNERTQFYPVGSRVPTFSVGQRDGLALRDLIAQAPAGGARLKIRFDVDMTPNMKSGTVWGTLPGTTDETIYVVAHRDGWFEGANDNASGMATMIGLADYFSKIPQAQRRRTIIFLGTTGHHNSGAQSGAWLTEHSEVFAKTALLVNAEHTGQGQTSQASPRSSNGPGAATWFAGSPKLSEIVVKALDAFEVPTYPQSAATPAGEIGRYYQFAPALQVMTSGFVWHSDQETAETISPTGLVSITRAYAKVMADVNAFDLKDLRTPAMSEPARGARGR